jgi:hypothetical protein
MPNVAWRKGHQSSGIHDTSRAAQGDLGRNALCGFGATQVDLTLRRQFKIRERLALQARADLFNIFNHPNFRSPINYLSSPQFGQSTQMLGASLGRRPEWLPQSAVSNWRPAIGATGPEASIPSMLDAAWSA